MSYSDSNIAMDFVELSKCEQFKYAFYNVIKKLMLKIVKDPIQLRSSNCTLYEQNLNNRIIGSYVCIKEYLCTVWDGRIYKSS